MASNIYLADLIQSKSLTNFQSLLEALNNDPNLADATKKSLKGTTANLQISTESQYQILKTKLRTQWEGYTAPTKTVNTHISEFNKYFLDNISFIILVLILSQLEPSMRLLFHQHSPRFVVVR